MSPPRQFDSLTASELYCPQCRKSQPVRERLLLVLPRAELYEYRCIQCSASLGSREVSSPPGVLAIPTGPLRPRPPARGRSRPSSFPGGNVDRASQ